VVAHAFHLGEWVPDATDNIRGRVLFYWTVPARVGGRWRVESEDGNFTLDIAQSFQTFEARADVKERLIARLIEAHTTATKGGRIDGAEIRFAIDLGEGPRVFRGRVAGDAIHGLSPQGWKAVRSAK
jgi:hypothetical protein